MPFNIGEITMDAVENGAHTTQVLTLQVRNLLREIYIGQKP